LSSTDRDIQYEVLFNNISEGVYLLDLDGKTKMSNPSARKMLGYSEEEFNGKENPSKIMIPNR